jgi:trk system potassium uptake protein TrkH
MNIRSVIRINAVLLTVLGVAMLIPASVAYGYGEDVSAFLISATMCAVIGLSGWVFTRKHKKLTNKDGFTIVTIAWVVTALAGSLPFYIGGFIPNFTDAFFESMSGVTTTGATIIGNPLTLPNLPHGIESLPHGILFWRSFIQWIGGMGIIVFTIAILPLLGVGGVQLFRAEVPGPVADKITPRVRETAKYLWMVYFGFTLAETILLGVGGMDWFDAVCHSFTTMPTGGFSTKNASIAYYGNSYIHYIMILFMFFAGINFTLHFRAITGDVTSYFKDREFLYYLGITLCITLCISLGLYVQGNSWSHHHFRDSLFQTVSILTTTGYTTADYELWPYFAQFILLLLMFVGGMGGSTGGGMKIIRVILILKYIAIETRQMLHAKAIIPIRIGSRYISRDVIRNTVGFFLFYIFIFAATSLVLSAMDLDLSSAIGLAASAIGNIGPAFGDFGPTENYAMLPDIGKWLLSFCMLLGRLEIFTVMVLFSRTFRD